MYVNVKCPNMYIKNIFIYIYIYVYIYIYIYIYIYMYIYIIFLIFCIHWCFALLAKIKASVHYFLSFFFSPDDSHSKAMKNVYFI